ncbi:DUF3140 domain-containing protein [Streptomyces qaidamensis]|uniref:DUF3140 domain-containing protein n=1 Tax=Streptomyces qaidamensis TaxID=1783515 RepID=UPI00099F5DFD|nr:DUF3140 domain-containing protein [Streptomyces qaidamensis]
MDDEEREETWNDFRELVNMTPADLEKWLESDASQSVGQQQDGGESTGHASGRRIAAIETRSARDQCASFSCGVTATPFSAWLIWCWVSSATARASSTTSPRSRMRLA